MAFLKRDLSPEVAGGDRCTLVFDTDSRRVYVELEVAHLDAATAGAVDAHTATMEIADCLRQGGQAAGHCELWRLVRTLFDENSDDAEYADEASSAATTYDKFRIWENYHCE